MNVALGTIGSWESGVFVRVLIIEDEALLALEYEMLLEDIGCEPIGVARDSVSALAMARDMRPDLALVDVNLLDGMTGADAGVAIAAHLGVAVLFVTSEARHVDLSTVNVLGSLPKPFTSTTFLAAINWARDVVSGRSVAGPPAGVLSIP